MLLPVIAIIAGILLLMWSADRLVEGAAAVAARLGVSQMIVGMVIVGFGTSLPEMTVSALSAWQGMPGLAIGNAYGSNIANITLILGVAAAANPIRVKPGLDRRELPILIAATLISAALIAFDMTISRLDALALLVLFAVSMWLSMRGARPDCACDEEPRTCRLSPTASVVWILVGLAVLIASSQLLVWGATEVAKTLGVSDLVIGLTVVAVGTSLPELASSLAAARKNCHDIAIGNVIGSNIFNTLAVVGIAGAISPMDVEYAVLWRDLPAMIFATGILFCLCRGRKGGPALITRAHGAALLALFALYTAWVALSAAS